LFQAVEESSFKVVIDAMQCKSFKAGDVVIQEGDNGDCLYIVESG